MSINPYGAPAANLEFRSSAGLGPGGCWRIGKDTLFVSGAGRLPPRCVKCNGPARQPVKERTYYWHSSALYLLILLNLIIYALVASIVRKKVRLSPALCDRHARMRGRALYGSLAGFGLLLVAALAAIGRGMGITALLCFLAALAVGIAGSLLTRIVHAVGIDASGARFKGCGAEFLDSLEANPAT